MTVLGGSEPRRARKLFRRGKHDSTPASERRRRFARWRWGADEDWDGRDRAVSWGRRGPWRRDTASAEPEKKMMGFENDEAPPCDAQEDTFWTCYDSRPGTRESRHALSSQLNAWPLRTIAIARFPAGQVALSGDWDVASRSPFFAAPRLGDSELSLNLPRSSLLLFVLDSISASLPVLLE